MLQTFHRRFRQTSHDLEGSHHRVADPSSAPPHASAPLVERRFTHKALDDTQSAIRLVTVSSELSTDGSIQCYVSHSTLDRASYVCLSYTWGPPEPQSKILINGLPFYVGKNVFDFLEMVRTMSMTFYWIDAMCVDQANIPERNKQVAQMGQIFSKAFLVYLWLGKLPPMAGFMRYFDGSSRTTDSAKKSFWENTPEARDTVKSLVLNHDYWSRAWVTQEICVARAVLVTLCRESFKLPDFLKTMRRFDEIEPGSFRNSTLAQFADTLNSSKHHTKSLMILLDEAREKKCEVPRDRVFSLLSLCSNFQLPEVKYDQPSEDLAYDVLRRADEPLCICSALLVAQTLRLASKQILDEDIHAPTFTALEFEIKGLRFSRHAMMCNDKILSWADYKMIGTDIFGHDLLLTDVCPGLHALMEVLQERARNGAATSSNSKDGLNPAYVKSAPYLLKMMDEEHVQAILGKFGTALDIETNPAHQDTTNFRVGLRLLAKLVPHSVPLCRRVSQGKAKRAEMDREAASPTPHSMDPSFAAQSRDACGSRDFRGREGSLFKIDSATSHRSWEDEGPVSSYRLRRLSLGGLG